MSEVYDIVARVISQKGTCANEHKIGDEVLFTGDSVSFGSLLHVAQGLRHALRGSLPLAGRSECDDPCLS